MKNVTCYLAQPVDFGSADTSLVMETMGQLAAMNWTVYDPKSAFSVSATPHGAVSVVNQAAMDACTGGVAFLPSTARSVGVPAEIGYMSARCKPVLVVTDLDRSWVVAGWADDAEPNIEVVPMTPEDVAAGLDWLRDRMSYLDDCGAGADAVDPVVFGRMHPDATLPTKGYADDAGFDLYALADVTVPARGQAEVSCGVSVDVPEGTWAQITGRSSTLKKRNLMVAPTVGVIDEGYTGELFAPIVSISDEPVHIAAGDRVAQLILHEAPGQRFRPVWGQVRNKARGSNGFGSTGR